MVFMRLWKELKYKLSIQFFPYFLILSTESY